MNNEKWQIQMNYNNTIRIALRERLYINDYISRKHYAAKLLARSTADTRREGAGWKKRESTLPTKAKTHSKQQHKTT